MYVQNGNTSLARAQRALVQPRNNHYLLVKQSLVKNVFVFGPVYMYTVDRKYHSFCSLSVDI